MVLSKVAPEENAAALLGLGVIGKQSKPAFTLIAKGLELRHHVAHAGFEAIRRHRDVDAAFLVPLNEPRLLKIRPVSHIISLNAGAGQFEGEDRHYWWPGRVARSFQAVHRKAQDAVYQRLHKLAEIGELQGFGMVYLGQQDAKLPWAPSDLVCREQVRHYPTDFAPMSAKDLELLAKRGEQLTHIIVDRYLPGLGD